MRTTGVLSLCLSLVLAALVTVVSLASGGVTHHPAMANDEAPDVTLFPVTIIFPTATRTPTPINVGNFVWDDLDGDGRQDAGEAGLAGVTVQLWNSTKTQLIDSAVTNASGIYSLVAPTPGNYRVRVLLPSISDQFSPKDQAGGDDQKDSDISQSGVNFGFTDVYVFGSNLISITTIDAGIVKFYTPTPTRTPTPINIGNFIWADADGDGVQDAGELGLAGVTVQLWNSTKTQLLDTAVTSASGSYTVVAPTPGDYRVRVLLGIGASFSPKDNSVNDQTDSDCNAAGVHVGFTDVFDIADNVISTTIFDCGLLGPYSTPTPTLTPSVTPTPTATPTLDPELTETVVVPAPENPNYLPVVVQ